MDAKTPVKRKWGKAQKERKGNGKHKAIRKDIKRARGREAYTTNATSEQRKVYKTDWCTWMSKAPLQWMKPSEAQKSNLL